MKIKYKSLPFAPAGGLASATCAGEALLPRLEALAPGSGVRVGGGGGRLPPAARGPLEPRQQSGSPIVRR
jgi:hypothetical protein